MTFILTTLLIVSALNLLLGFFIFYKNKTKIINLSYFLFCLSVAVWSFGMFMYYESGLDYEKVFVWSKILYSAGSFLALFFLWFSINYTDKPYKKIFPHFIILSILPLFICFFIFKNLIISDIEFYPGNTKLILGPLWWLYYFQFYLCFAWAFILLFKYNKNSFGIEKLKSFYIIFGSLIPCCGATLVNMIFPYFGNYRYAWLGPVFLVILLYSIFYSIVKYQFLNVKMVMRRYSVYLCSFIAILIFATAFKYSIALISPELSVQADLIILILSILVFSPIKAYFYKIANKYFFSSLYDSRAVISEITDKLRSTLDIKKIYNFIYETLDKSFHPQSFAILSYDENKNAYLVQYNIGFITKGQKEFLENKKLHDFFIDRNKSIIVEELKEHYYSSETAEAIKLLTELKVEILTPLNIKDKTVGLMVLGRKESGDIYNDEDMQVLKIIGGQAAMAIENALLYEETLNFNTKLKKEIERATSDLRKANEQLKKLDAAKSEFISIASHQLRTPLTVIKGYISMMLEGNFGPLTPQIHDSLKKVYESGERLIQLVENLLNISRIESGRLQFSFIELDLREMVESVLEELAGAADRKGLKLEFKKPAKSLHKIIADQEKLRQVVMNLIDNAIKYTQHGTISISLKEEKGKIKFCVNDKGMGVSAEDLPRLFKKFSRGKGTSVIHTEGTGLGLYVAKQMIDSHKGKIWAESDGKGKGAKFCFMIPIKSKATVKK